MAISYKSSKLTTYAVALSISFAALAGCAGRTPHPIPLYQPTDESLSCHRIRAEIMQNQDKILNLVPQQNKTGKNVGLGVAGAFLIVPWFFMDFSDAERVEVEAYQQRNSYLMSLADEKKCGKLPPPIKFKNK